MTIEKEALNSLTYRTGLDRLGVAAQNDAFRIMERLVELRREDSTDQAPGQWREPARHYTDPERFRTELDAVHRSVPLPLALSAEMPDPGNYKALSVAGTPVLITRDSGGRVHAMVNSCRHRGAELVEAGTGATRRFTCPYHSWSYGLDGCLRGVYGEKTTGPIDKSTMGLRTLPAEERAGIIFVGLDPNLDWDLDDWLGDYAPILEGLNLASCHHWSMRTIPGPNWKVALDGYLEGYHFSTVHKDSLFKTTHSNCAAFDSWGPHLRSSFALRAIDEQALLPREEWDPSLTVGIAAVLFPGLSIAGGWRDKMAISLILPGDTVDTSITQQHILLRDKPADDVEAKDADTTSEWFYDVVLDEDYAVNFGVQRALQGAPADHELVFMRNEPGVQHFHRVVDARVNGVPIKPARAIADHLYPQGSPAQ